MRDPGAAAGLPVDVRPGSFDEPDVLRASLAGAATVLVNATFFGADPGLRRDRVLDAIAAASSAGAGHIVLTSWPDLDHCTIPVVHDYNDLEGLDAVAGRVDRISRLLGRPSET